jgi:hypothetical protein
MWLMTKHGFYSIVERKPAEFHIRSREARDLQNLVEQIPLPHCSVILTPEADYAARIVTDRETVRSVMGFLAESLDYSNFKGKIDTTEDQLHKPYHEVWGVMASALGAYGRPGTAKPTRHD